MSKAVPKKRARKKSQTSLFGYYCVAAKVAVGLGIGLEYAFKRYVEPTIPKDVVVPGFTPEESAVLCVSLRKAKGV